MENALLAGLSKMTNSCQIPLPQSVYTFFVRLFVYYLYPLLPYAKAFAKPNPIWVIWSYISHGQLFSLEQAS